MPLQDLEQAKLRVANVLRDIEELHALRVGEKLNLNKVRHGIH